VKIKEHDCVVLKADLPDEKFKAGDVGTVVHIYADGAAYEVEFFTRDGKTIAVTTVESADLCPIVKDAKGKK
jgi:fibrillarin-like rRNA methylase